MLAILIGLAIFYYWDGKDDSQVFVTITLAEDGFEPKIIKVKKGTEIVFKNTDTKSHWPASDFHPTHGIYPEFDPLKGINSGEEWLVVLKPGKWPYHDHLYPSFVGTIEVEN